MVALVGALARSSALALALALCGVVYHAAVLLGVGLACAARGVAKLRARIGRVPRHSTPHAIAPTEQTVYHVRIG